MAFVQIRVSPVGMRNRKKKGRKEAAKTKERQKDKKHIGREKEEKKI
jgi:hypothetical protein